MTEDEAKTKACCGPPFIATASLIRADGFEVVEPEKFGKYEYTLFGISERVWFLAAGLAFVCWAAMTFQGV